MDAIDVRLVSLLQRAARLTQSELAAEVGLSAPAVAERIRKLEERGVIRGYSAVVDPRALGLGVTAFIAVVIGGSRHYPALAQRVADAGEVVECHSVTGSGSHLLKVRTATTGTLERLLAEIQSWPGVQSTTTSVVLSTMKERHAPSAEEIVQAMDEIEEREGSAAPAAWLHVPFRRDT